MCFPGIGALSFRQRLNFHHLNSKRSIMTQLSYTTVCIISASRGEASGSHHVVFRLPFTDRISMKKVTRFILGAIIQLHGVQRSMVQHVEPRSLNPMQLNSCALYKLSYLFYGNSIRKGKTEHYMVRPRGFTPVC